MQEKDDFIVDVDEKDNFLEQHGIIDRKIKILEFIL